MIIWTSGQLFSEADLLSISNTWDSVLELNLQNTTAHHVFSQEYELFKLPM